jgi:hypothetical protein
MTYNMHNIVKKHFSISIATVRSRGGKLALLNLLKSLKLSYGFTANQKNTPFILFPHFANTNRVN